MMKNVAIQIKPPKLHPWQKEFHKLLKKYDNEPSILIIKSPRQCGKSFMMELLLIETSLNNPGSESWFISIANHNSRKVYKDILRMLENIPCVKTANSQLLEIEFVNGSLINFGSSEQRSALRGNTVKGKGYLIIDEGAYIPDDIISDVTPYVNVGKQPIIIVSTPLFQSGRFYDLFTDTTNSMIHSFDVCDYDLSFFISEDQKKLYKRTLTTQKYLTDIEGSFITEYSNVFGNFKDVLSNSFNPLLKTYTYGIDWGSGSDGDYTAVSIFNENHQQVYLDYFNDLDATQTIERIKQLTLQFKPYKIVVEQNSIGRVFYDLLRKAINFPITLFNTTNDSKQRIINRLQIEIQNKTIQLLDNPELKLQLMNYQIEQTKSGKITFNASSGKHDDIIISIALALDGLITKGYAVY